MNNSIFFFVWISCSTYLVYTDTGYSRFKKNVNSEFIVHNSGTLKTERLEGQIILVLGSNKTKGPKLDSQNQLRSPMSEREGTLVLIIITLFRNCKFQKKYI